MLRSKGDVFRAEGSGASVQAAAECYRKSIEVARQQGALSWELHAAISRFELEGEADAQKLLSSIYARFTDGHGAGDPKRARALLA